MDTKKVITNVLITAVVGLTIYNTVKINKINKALAKKIGDVAAAHEQTAQQVKKDSSKLDELKNV